MSNVFSFTGTVGRDAETRATPSGQSVLNVTVANNIGFGDKQQTLWLRVTVWGKRAEGNLSQYLKKGQQVFVSGELSQQDYQAQDGSTKTQMVLNANIIDLIGKKSDQAPAPSQQQGNAQNSTHQQKPNPYAPQNADATDNWNDDIPF
jgi:single-strand DNA-binding protein